MVVPPALHLPLHEGTDMTMGEALVALGIWMERFSVGRNAMEVLLPLIERFISNKSIRFPTSMHLFNSVAACRFTATRLMMLLALFISRIYLPIFAMAIRQKSRVFCGLPYLYHQQSGFLICFMKCVCAAAIWRWLLVWRRQLHDGVSIARLPPLLAAGSR